MLHLNKTHLLYIPSVVVPGTVPKSPTSTSGTVVQVCIRDSKQNTHLFSLEQQCITNTIETLLFSHVNAAPKLPEQVVITNSRLGYTLIGVRKPWKYGRGKRFFLDDGHLQPAEDKWLFTFDVSR
ncbi:hypothetical protein J3A83DRAFT_1103781 [Scleroderma citrinum]